MSLRSKPTLALILFVPFYVILLKWLKSVTIYYLSNLPLGKKCPYSEFLWSVFSLIRTEYGEIRSKVFCSTVQLCPWVCHLSHMNIILELFFVIYMRRKGGVINIVLVFLLLTLNILYTFF